MAQNTRAAVNMVEAGHVRVGPEMVLDPAFLVPRFGRFFTFICFSVQSNLDHKYYLLEIFLKSGTKFSEKRGRDGGGPCCHEPCNLFSNPQRVLDIRHIFSPI